MTHATSTIARSFRLPSRAALIIAGYVAVFFIALPAVLWALGGRLDALLDLPRLAGPFARGIGSGVALFGVAWMGWSMLVLWRAGSGLPISHLPPTQLTTSGPYALVRHPIYVGYVAAFAGAGAATGSVGRAVGAASLVAVGTVIYALGFEESRLEHRFGVAYASYRACTPAFPRLLGGSLDAKLERVWRACRPAAEALANRTVLVRIGASVWVTYGLFAAAAAVVIGVGMAGFLAGAGVPRNLIARCLIGLVIAIPAGSRLMWLAYPARAPAQDAPGSLRQVGFVSWGGFLGAFGFTACFAWVSGLDPLRLLDAAAVAGLAGQAVARIGCFTYGCCYGRPARLGIRWTDPEAKPCREQGAAGTQPRVPTQLLLSLNALVVLTLAVGVALIDPPVGTVTGLALLLYSLGRFGVECLRADPRHGPWDLTKGQIGCAVTGTLGIAVLLTIPVAPAAHATGWTFDLAGVRPFVPVLAACVALVFGVYGFHWKRVGRW